MGGREQKIRLKFWDESTVEEILPEDWLERGGFNPIREERDIVHGL